jgi:hypothetical protein
MAVREKPATIADPVATFRRVLGPPAKPGRAMATSRHFWLHPRPGRRDPRRAADQKRYVFETRYAI